MRPHNRHNKPIPEHLKPFVALPGVGVETARQLYDQYGIHSLADLAAALKAGRLAKLPGFGVHRLHRLRRDTAVLIERQHAMPIAKAWPMALAIKSELADLPGVVNVAVTGAARRLRTMCPSIELVVACKDARAFEAWCDARHGVRTEHSVNLNLTTDDESIVLHLYPSSPDLFPLRLMATTGDETHIGIVQSMLKAKGIQWTDAGLVDEADRRIEVASEADIYALIDLPDYPPELREGRGILQSPEDLIQRSDIRGDLHAHSHWSDGTQTIAEMAEMAEKLGYAYFAVTDHSQSLTIAHGLTPQDLQKQRGEIEQVRQKTKVQILHGTEVDILPDGSLDFPDDVLASLDIVVASVHSAMHQSKAQMTKRLQRAMQHDAVDMMGHMTGRKIGIRAGYEFDIEAVFDTAVKMGKIVELNANPNRLDLKDESLRQATAAGLSISIDTDAHHLNEFENMQYGVRMAMRGWLKPAQVLNTLPYEALMARLHGGR